MPKKKVWLFIMILSLALGGLIFLGITLQKISNHKFRNNTKELLQANAEELIGLTMKIPGAKPDEYWELSCAKLINSNNQGKMSVINGQYYSAKKPLYHIVARSGLVNWGNPKVMFYGKVKVTTNNGYELMAEEMIWDSKTELLEAKQNVVLNTDTFIASTQQINADLKLNKIIFKGTTKVAFKELRGGK